MLAIDLHALKTWTDYTEQELLQLTANDNEGAFAELIRRYKTALERFVLSVIKSPELTIELIQDTFIQVWLIREGLENVENFKSYLFIICRNRAFNAFKKEVTIQRNKRKWIDEVQHANIVPHEEETELQDLLDDAVKSLPAQQRKAWELSRREGYKYGEIATIMEISKETAKKHIQLANSQIARYLNEKKGILMVILWALWEG